MLAFLGDEVLQVISLDRPEAPRPLFVDVGDLDAIKRRGRLRVLVYGQGEEVLPRAGASMNVGEETALQLAADLGLKADLIAVDRFSDLIPMLLQGRGDLIAARLTVTKARSSEVAFTRPVSSVDEVVVIRKGDVSAPHTVAALAGQTVTVRNSSAYHETLIGLKATEVPTLVIANTEEDRDTYRLLHDVAVGTIAATVSDSDIVDNVAAYEPGIVAAFPVARDREIAFAVRPSNPALKTAADAWLIERTLTSSRDRIRKTDFDAIKKRGSLRVLSRNNAVSYFLYKGIQQGFDYEFMALFAKKHGLRIELIVPPEASDLIPWLEEGRGDVIAASLTVTPDRQQKVWFSPPYNMVDEVIVQRKGAPAIATLEGLKGQTFHVRPSSAYRQTLDALQLSYGPFTLVDAAEDDETEDLISMVVAGRIPATVADSTIAAIESAWRDGLQTGVIVAEGKSIALATRRDAPQLQAALTTFVTSHVHLDDTGHMRGSVEYNILKRQYFESPRHARESATKFKNTGALSPYDELIMGFATQYGLDWRLMAAQAYQESRFDPDARSWVGALGLFQVMPRTGHELGFERLADPAEGTHAGVRYMARLIDSFDTSISFKNRVRFALASYNAGRGHVEDARRLAVDMKLDPGVWFRNVEQAMLRLEDKSIYRHTRHGYCRGSEPVKYVSEISLRYENYVTIVPNPGASAPSLVAGAP